MYIYVYIYIYIYIYMYIYIYIYIYIDQCSKVLYSSFLFYAKLGLLKCIETKLQTTCFYLI